MDIMTYVQDNIMWLWNTICPEEAVEENNILIF